MTPEIIASKISSAEKAARHSRLGYNYQDLIAASFCIEMLRDKRLRKVSCETLDDVVLTWRTEDGNELEEYVQVKSDRLTQQWTIATFCQQERVTSKPRTDDSLIYRKDTSIFEKNASQARNKYTGRFRIVTRADVKDLRLLTESRTDRDKIKAASLAENLEKALNSNTSLASNDITYWVAEAIWDVRGSESAVYDELFRHLAQAVESQEGRLLAVLELERILKDLTTGASAMATGKGVFGANSNEVTEEELRSWLKATVQKVPFFLGSIENDALLREERRSLARCETLWLALNVPQIEASALARQSDIGARQAFFGSLGNGFHWVTGAYGMGKSIAAERLFQLKLADYSTQRDQRAPIFLRAVEVTGSLQDVILLRIRDLQKDGGISKLFVVLDAVDETGVERAHSLLIEARELSATWRDSTFIAISTDLPFSLDQFRRPLPVLSEEAAAEIVSRFAHAEVPFWIVREHLGSDIGLALMCVLLGMALQEKAYSYPSHGELLHWVVEKAQKRSGKDSIEWAKESDRLCRIAMLSTDGGGRPLRPSELGLSALDLAPLYLTRLVIEEAGQIVFTVTTIRFWFASQALSKRWIDPIKLFADLQRTRQWQQPLIIFLNRSDFDSSRYYFEPLASKYPAIAAHVIVNATRQYGSRKRRTPIELLEFGQRLRSCFEAWTVGIGPLAPFCNFLDDDGHVLKVIAVDSTSHTQIILTDEPSIPTVSVTAAGSKIDSGKLYIGYRESDEPIHLWRQTFSIVASNVRNIVIRDLWALSDPILIHEAVWNEAIYLTGSSRLFSSSIQWEVIEQHEKSFKFSRMWEWLCEKRYQSPVAFFSPHPSADIKNPTSPLIANYYSAEAACRYARSVYSGAFYAYQRIVSSYFPQFVHDFSLTALWPCKLIGEIEKVHGKNENYDWHVSYHYEVVESEKESGVDFKLGKRQNFWLDENAERLQDKHKQLRPNASNTVWVMNSTFEWAACPTTSLVKKWLLSDLDKAGWNQF